MDPNEYQRGQQPPSGGGGYTIFVPGFMGGQQQYDHPPQEQPMKLTQQQLDRKFIMDLRVKAAYARPSEVKILLDGMEEIRMAIGMAKVKDDADIGTTERPPIEPAFDDINRGRLQNSYLMMVERYVNYCDRMLIKEMDVQITNEIRKPYADQTTEKEE